MGSGTLFTEDFLAEGIRQSPNWRELSDDSVTEYRRRIGEVFTAVAKRDGLNEAQTQHRIIEPILGVLGWSNAFSVQTNLDGRGRRNVADYTLFSDPTKRSASDTAATQDAKLKHAVAVADAKQWSVGLDQAGAGAGYKETPSAQIIRYLTRAEAVSDRAVRWAVLTNGRHWRLYFSGARSLLDGYFEVDLAWAIGLPGTQGDLPLGDGAVGADEEERDRLFRSFLLLFSRAAFQPSALLGDRIFPEFAFAEGRLWEAKVRTDLSKVVFEQVFPGLIRALAATDPAVPDPLTPAYLLRVREAALTMLYRLLFALYAEDRDLLPARDPRFDNYALSPLRDEIADRLDRRDAITNRSTRYWDHCVALFRIVDEGDHDLGIPPYNGGLFARPRAPLIEGLRVGDAIFAPLLDLLSRTRKGDRKVRINFRDLSVRELGAIYEGLLEYEPVAEPNAQQGIAVRPNPFSRKTSGSYYTPDELVTLIIERTVGPLVRERSASFVAAAERLAEDARPVADRLAELELSDPASAILTLRVCDPAMGSGHFLVSLIDYLAGEIFTATGEASTMVAWAEYRSPILERLAEIRQRIKGEAEANGWTVGDDQLTDVNLVKRMVLKRCVYGVDKNPMAVELAKVALWLHTFTTGAPLSFLDHHLKCGDSLFGEKVGRALDELSRRGTLLIADAVRRAEAEVADMQAVEENTDAEVAEVKASAEAYANVQAGTAPLWRFLDFWQAIRWLDLTNADRRALDALLDGRFGDPVMVAAGLEPPQRPAGAPETMSLALGDEPDQLTLSGSGVVSVREWSTVSTLLDRAHRLAAEEHFFHWEVAFPGVWRQWQSPDPAGGFDAVIGNPPWDRMKMQEVEWFAARSPEVARHARAADRKVAVARLIEGRTELGAKYSLARARAEKAMERARKSGDYPLLSRGDINIYSLFVERAQALISPGGIAGLLTPSGIASDLTASAFFKSVASAGRVRCIFDYENRGRWFPDVHRSFKFCIFVVGGSRRAGGATECGFYLEDIPDNVQPDQLFSLTSIDFALVNPNTGTAPIFRTRCDAELTTAIYRRLPVLVRRDGQTETKAWPARYVRMYDMTNDSGLFWTRQRLEAEGAYPLRGGKWRKGDGEVVPLYVGRMIHQFDHRAASVAVNEQNIHNAAISEDSSPADLSDPNYFPQPQFWVEANSVSGLDQVAFAFRDIARSTDERTAIGAILPSCAAGNTLPLIQGMDASILTLFAAQFNAFVFDYVARQKNQSTHLNWYIVEQLPTVPPEKYSQSLGATSVEALVRNHVLRLTYTAHDMAPFARDMGFDGPPFIWNEDERRHLRARLDALYFHLYGITDEADIRYILSTFPIVERKDREAHGGVYLTAEMIVWYFRALAAGDTTTDAPVEVLLRAAGRS